MSIEQIVDSLHFIAAEARGQVDNAYKAMTTLDDSLVNRVEMRDDYVDSLKLSIVQQCFKFPCSGFETAQDYQTVQPSSYLSMAGSLEHIADLAVNQVRQVVYLKGNQYRLEDFRIQDFYHLVCRELDNIPAALDTAGTDNLVQSICAVEGELDDLYREQFARIVELLRQPRDNHHQLLTLVFILHAYERMGDELLNIGEALLHLSGVQRLKYQQWRSFRRVVDRITGEKNYATRMQSIMGTRSGNRIGALELEDRSAIFKEGFVSKIEEELEKIQQWNRLFPGLVPKILEVERRDSRAAVVVEYLEGSLLQDVFTQGDASTITNGMRVLRTTVQHIWDTTVETVPSPVMAMEQIRSRLSALYTIHPSLEGLRRHRLCLGRHCLQDLDHLLNGLEKLSVAWQAPYRVWLHGDFNTNNVIYNAKEGRIHYIDVHRTHPGDPAEDLAVFVLSNVRLPVAEPLLRGQMAVVNRAMVDFGRRFAHGRGDLAFDRRLALAIARNFITSARFEVDPGRAEHFYLRGVGLLEQVLRTARSRSFRFDGHWIAF